MYRTIHPIHKVLCTHIGICNTVHSWPLIPPSQHAFNVLGQMSIHNTYVERWHGDSLTSQSLQSDQCLLIERTSSDLKGKVLLNAELKLLAKFLNYVRISHTTKIAIIYNGRGMTWFPREQIGG